MGRLTSSSPVASLATKAGREAASLARPPSQDFFPLYVPGPPPVDQVAVEERASSLAKRSIKKGAKVAGLKLAVAMMDLTTLEGKDSAGKVRALCNKALRPLDTDASVGPCAAICVYPNLVPIAKRALEGSTVKVASVATAFPSGQSPLDIKLQDVRRAVEFGADEIDMVIDRGAMLSGQYAKVYDEIAATKEACGAAHLKVILETGELGSYDVVRRASEIGIAAGGDFIKTSTGKVQPAATPPVTLVMLETIRDHYYATGRKIGMKPAGGVRTAKQALHYLVLVKETLGDEWLTPDLFRFGASALLNDVLMQLEKERTGDYQAAEDFSKD
ncbi:deoxyribose-phosphate aldolase [Pendulispora rubella]|uniref:Deoxyribose-phosphate aldolase n=1 Tax=Pendulispora rubella TaxID=2741070 RepID=A0ABZ2LCK5_9BACT